MEGTVDWFKIGFGLRFFPFPFVYRSPSKSQLPSQFPIAPRESWRNGMAEKKSNLLAPLSIWRVSARLPCGVRCAIRIDRVPGSLVVE
jgi:hypothetical protein